MSETTETAKQGLGAGLRTVMKFALTMHCRLYRVSNGRFGGKVRGAPVLLLTTTGRKTGQPRTWPVAYLADGADLIIIASAGGQPRHPAWYLNLRATPQVTVQVGARTQPMVARVTAGDERAQLWARVVRAYPAFAGYERKTTRQIPVVVLHAESAAPG